MVQWFRGRRASGDEAVVSDSPNDLPDDPTRGGVADPDAPHDRTGLPLTRWTRREYTLSRLQEGYDRVLELMDAMHRHMQAQQDRTEQIATGISQLSRSLSDLPGITQQQVQLLSAIAAQLETTTVRTQQLSDAVGELPRVIRGQSEALTGVQRQLEMATESDAHLTSSLQSFERAINRFGESSENQAAATRELRLSSDEHQRRLGHIIEQQTRRFTVLMAVTAVLAGAGIIVGALAVVLHVLR